MDKRIKGIQIEIGAQTKGLDAALKNVNSRSRSLQGELRSVERLLKFDSKNVDMLRQKQELLTKAVSNTKIKLDSLKTAQSQVNEQFQKGDISEEQYRAFTREVAKTENELKRLEGSLNDTGKAAKKSGADAEKSTSKWKSFGNAAVKVGKSVVSVGAKIGKVAVTAVAAVSAIAAAMGKKAIDAALEYENSLAKVATIADTVAVPLAEMSKGVLEASNKTGIAATEINEAMYQAISAGANSADALGLVEIALKAAKGGFTDSTTAIDGLTSTLNAYNLETNDADRIANQFLVTQNKGKTTFGELAESIGDVAPTANAAGVASGDLMASLAALTANGIDTSSAVTGMKAALSNVIKPSGEAAKMAEKLGLNFSAAHLNSVGWGQFLEEIKDKTGGDIEVMGKLFGSVEGLNSMLTLTSDGGMSLFNETLAEMEQNTDAVNDAFNTMANTTGEKLNRALNTVKNVGIQIGGTLAPAVEKAAGYIQDFTTAFADADGDMGKFADTAGGIVVRILVEIVEALPKFIEVGSTILSSLIQGLIQNIDAITGAAIQILDAIIGMINDMLPDIAKAAVIILNALVEGLVNNADELANTAVEVVMTLIDGLVQALPKLVEAGIKIVISLIQGIANALPQLIPTIVEAIFTIIQTISNNLTLIVNAAIQLIQALIKGMINALPLIIKVMPQIIDTIITGMIEGLVLILENAAEIIQAIVDGIMTALPLLVEAIPTIIDTIITGMIEGLVLILENAAEIIQAIVDGIILALPLLVEAIPTIIDAIISAVVENLPLIIEAGVNLLLSLIEGIIECLPELIKAIISLIPKIVQAIVDNLPKIIEAGIKITMAIIRGIVEAVPKLIKGIVGMIPEIVQAIIDNLPLIIEAGIEIVWALIKGIGEAAWELIKAAGDLAWNFLTGIWEGIKNGAKWLWDKITGFFSGIVDGVKDFLGIHSPSRVFADIGKNMSLGLADGIKNSTGLVDKAMEKLQGSVSGVKANLNVNANGTSSVAEGAKPTNAVTLNVYANKLDEGQINMLVSTINRRLGYSY